MKLRIITPVLLLIFPLGERLIHNEASSPNILMIAIDDLRPELGCYGKRAITPNIDRLADSGLQFNRAYTNQAVCGASRLSIMTGLYPEFTKERTYHVKGWRERWSDLVTMNLHFKNNGYTTIGLGKVYHGAKGPGVDPTNWTKWINTGGKQYANRIPGERPSTESADVDEDLYLDGNRTAEGVKQIKELTKGDKPFFLAVGFSKPHLPFNAPTKYWEMYDREDFTMPENLSIPPGYPKWASNPFAAELRNYSDIPDRSVAIKDFPMDLNLQLIHGYHACVSYIDNCVGRLLDALEKSGAADNTIIVLWSDHGWKLGDHNSWVKHTNFEVDTRVPLIIKHPKMKEAKGVSGSLVELIDLYPTLCELTGINPPNHLQGKSMVSVLKDPSAEHREYVYSSYPHKDNKTKKDYIGHSIRNDSIRYTEWWEKSTDKVVGSVATNLNIDPGETTNMLLEHKDLAINLSEVLKEKVMSVRQ